MRFVEHVRGQKEGNLRYLRQIWQANNPPTSSSHCAEVTQSDILIVEDDPYYFLQEGTYVPRHLRQQIAHDMTEDQANQQFLDSLAPSYLKWAFVYYSPLFKELIFVLYRFDYQGRVIRLDTFSKVGNYLIHTFWRAA